jgi:hypothetical protein
MLNTYDRHSYGILRASREDETRIGVTRFLSASREALFVEADRGV